MYRKGQDYYIPHGEFEYIKKQGQNESRKLLFKYLDTKTNEYSNSLLGESTRSNYIIVVPKLCKQPVYIISTQLEHMHTPKHSYICLPKCIRGYS